MISKTAPTGKNKIKVNQHKKLKIPYNRKPEVLTFEEWQIALRKQFSEQQKFKIKNIGDHAVYSDFEVTNPISKKSYKVAIRSIDDRLNFCSCPDFKVNNLGTCKHIENVFSFLSSNKRTSKLLASKYERSYSSVSVKYGLERKIILRIGTTNATRMKKLAAEYFDNNYVLKRNSFDKFDQFLEKVFRLDHQFICYDDAMNFIIAERENAARQKLIKNNFPTGIKSKALDKIINTTLYDYQKEAVLKAANAGRFLIADDMGLGKTIQSLAVAELLKKYMGIEKVLIICPTSLKYQWETEIKKFTASSVIVIEGFQQQREQQYQSKAFYQIASYNAVTRDIKKINKASFDLIILDEAQRIKNWKTKTAQSIKQLNSNYCLVLTGTPLENKLEELHSLVEFVDKYRLGLMSKFLYDHRITDESGKVIGYKDLNKIGQSISEICIRRTKKEVLKQLPARIDKTLMVNVTQEQMDQHSEYYEAVCRLVNKWRRFGYLSEKERQILLIQLNRMRMVSDSTYIIDQKTRYDTKIAELRSVLEEIFQSKEEKVVIFSQWERMTRLVAQELEEMGINFEYLHGGVPAAERKNLLVNFKEDEKCRVFLSTDAGGVGLNLQSASFLINMDCPWNPAVLEQRIGRIHRLGQTKPVTIINFISRGTIEERMLSLLAFKKQMFEGVLDGGEDMIFMGESKMKQFMKTVEQLTSENKEGKNIADENSIFEDRELVSEEPDSIDEYAPVGLQDSKRPNHSIEPVQNFQSSVNTNVVDLLKTGIHILEKLSEVISNPEVVQSMVNRMVEKDVATGKSYLKIPIENDQLAKAADVLNTFFQMIDKR